MNKPSGTDKSKTIIHPLAPVWNAESRVLILGTMPSPASRSAGFFYMHPQNRFWCVLPAVFGETLSYTNQGLLSERFATPCNQPNVHGTRKEQSALTASALNAPNREAAIAERRTFLLLHNIALWDVLSSCEIEGVADSSIHNAVPNDFHKIFAGSKIRRVFCTGKTAFNLWKKLCATEYESLYNLTAECLPSTSPANAACSLKKLTEAYKIDLFDNFVIEPGDEF